VAAKVRIPRWNTLASSNCLFAMVSFSSKLDPLFGTFRIAATRQRTDDLDESSSAQLLAGAEG